MTITAPEDPDCPDCSAPLDTRLTDFGYGDVTERSGLSDLWVTLISAWDDDAD